MKEILNNGVIAKVTLKRLSENDLRHCNVKCLKKKREQKKEENLNSPPKAYDLISKYSCKIPLPSVPIASTSSQPGTTVTKNHLLKHPQEESIPQPENPSNKDEIVKPVIRVKSSKELGIVEFSGKEHDNTNLLGNCKREILDLEKKTLLDRYIAVVKHYFTQERIYLIVDLVDTLRSALIVLCKKKILKVYNSEELNNADCSVLQEFSKKFVNTFSKALEKVDDSHKTLFVTATFSVITKQVEVRQFSVEIVQTVIKKLLKLESYSDEIVIEILEHKNFGSKINVLKNILIHHIDFGKFENLVSFKNEEVKSEEDEENFQKEEQKQANFNSVVCWRTNCEAKAQTICDCFTRSYCSQQCLQDDWANDHWENCRGKASQAEYLATQT